MFALARRLMPMTVLSVSVLLLLAACGGGGGGGGEAGNGGVTQPTAPTTRPLGTHSIALASSDPLEHQSQVLRVLGSGDVLRYEWDFGNGQKLTSSSPEVQHSFSEGEYTVGLNVVGVAGDASAASLKLKIRHAQPQVFLDVVEDSETPWLTGGVLYFSSRLLYDARRKSVVPEGNSYLWDFGDGNSASIAAPSHTYAKAGEFTVTLTLTDRYGRTSNASRKVKVISASARPLRTPLGGPGYQDMGSISLFNQPQALVRAADGTLFVYDAGNRVVRRIAKNGLVSTLAGARTKYAEVRDGKGQEARFADVRAMALDDKGTLYLADSSGGLRSLAPDGSVKTLVATAATPKDGDSGSAALVDPRALAMRKDGSIYVNSGAGIALLKNGEFSLVAGQVSARGYVDGPAGQARFGHIAALTLDNQERLLILDGCGGLRRLDPDGKVSTVVPLKTPSTNPENCYPSRGAITVAADGSVYLSALTITGGGDVAAMRLTPDGNRQEVLPTTWSPESMAVDGNDLLFASRDDHTIKRRRSDGVIVVEAGRDGNDSSAQFPYPAASDLYDAAESLVISINGDIYLSSRGRLLQFDARLQQARLVYGHAEPFWINRIADGPRGQAGIGQVTDLTVDGAGRLYFVDQNTVRCYTPDGWLRTVAGSASEYSDVDGPGHLARFGHIRRIAADKSGSIYVLTQAPGVSRIAQIDSSGTVSTLLRTPSAISDMVLTGAGQLVLQMDGSQQLMGKDGSLKTLNDLGSSFNLGWTAHPDGSIWMLWGNPYTSLGSPENTRELVRIQVDGRVEKVLKLSTVKAMLFFGFDPIELSIGASAMAFRADGALLISGGRRRGSYWLLENLP